MIARREHSERVDTYVYVPLRMGEDGTWASLVRAGGFFYHAIDAGKVCADDLQRRYAAIARQARLVRALCEHPAFAFASDGIDADMVREHARALSRMVAAEVDTVARLVSEPRAGDHIVIGGVTCDVNEEETTIEPRSEVLG